VLKVDFGEFLRIWQIILTDCTRHSFRIRMIISRLIIAIYTFLILFELRQVWTCLNYVHKIFIKPHLNLLIQRVKSVIPHLKHRSFQLLRST
jgi:hypothetical protein